jgi:hypothetical protein
MTGLYYHKSVMHWVCSLACRNASCWFALTGPEEQQDGRRKFCAASASTSTLWRGWLGSYGGEDLPDDIR